MDVLTTTTPFATLDAIHGQRAMDVYDVLVNSENIDESWFTLIENDGDLKARLTEQGITEPSKKSSIQWDDAVLFFTSILMMTKDGTPLQIGDSKTRERFGRFPYQNGSTMEYILSFICPSNHKDKTSEEDEIYSELDELLNALSQRCSESWVGHQRFTKGSGGLNIAGFLTHEEVRTVRLHLASRVWTVSKDEPLDGGLADAMRHLIALLKAAERRNVGLVLRYHA